MKTCIILTLILLASFESRSQIKPLVLISPAAKPNISFSDSALFKKKPSSIIQLNNPLTKIGTNGNGFNLYKSGIDNMIVMKPDSSNIVSTYIPNAISANNSFHRNPQIKILIDSLSKRE